MLPHCFLYALLRLLLWPVALVRGRRVRLWCVAVAAALAFVSAGDVGGAAAMVSVGV